MQILGQTGNFTCFSVDGILFVAAAKRIYMGKTIISSIKLLSKQSIQIDFLYMHTLPLLFHKYDFSKSYFNNPRHSSSLSIWEEDIYEIK